MLVTTTNLTNREYEYIDLVFGEVVCGINMFKDIGAGIRNIVGGRSKGYEKEIIKARKDALDEMKSRAASLGADAIMGIKFDYEAVCDGMMFVSCAGTAVKLK